jgi:hypothetical protein
MRLRHGHEWASARLPTNAVIQPGAKIAQERRGCSLIALAVFSAAAMTPLAFFVL